MLWRAFGSHNDDLVLLVPVLVMAAGQLAGGLAWLAISGEDAPDLVATAPIPARFIVRAKIEAVTGSVALVFAPFVVAMALASPHDALIAAAGIGVSAASATLIQLWFRTQARRKHFRRRQTSSRVATFAEAFSSISWAGDRGPRRRRPLAGRDHGADRARHPVRRAGAQPEASYSRALTSALGQWSARRKIGSRRHMANRTHLVVMPGDGIGPEIMAATLHVLREVDRLVSLGLTLRRGADRFRGAEGARHHPARLLVRGRQARRRRDPRAGVAQRLSAGRPGRAQSVRRDAKAARSLRQHPPGEVAARPAAALRQAGRSRGGAREHRRLLRRPQHVHGQRRVHADAGRGAGGAQDHAPGLDADRRDRVQARDDSGRAGRSPPCTRPTCCASPTGCSWNACARCRRTIRRSSTRSRSWTRWRRCWCATPAAST